MPPGVKSMSLAIPGIHHIMAICGPPQANLDFYVGTLRQRLVNSMIPPCTISSAVRQAGCQLRS